SDSFVIAPAPTHTSLLSLHDALPILAPAMPAQLANRGEVNLGNTTALEVIKETASNTFHKAGAALNVPEKRPEVASVSTETVFDEGFDLNPKPEPAEKAIATTQTETPASEETYLEELDEEVSASNEIAPDLVAETGSVVAVPEVKNQTQTPEKP